MVFFFERHHDVCISGANQSRGSVHVVDRAVGQSNVIEDVVHLLRRDLLADGRLDEVASLAVSSIRVPLFTRICRMNCPLSLAGKKF